MKEVRSAINKQLQEELIPIIRQMIEVCKKYNHKEGVSVYINNRANDDYMSFFSLVDSDERDENGENLSYYVLDYTEYNDSVEEEEDGSAVSCD